MAAMALRAANLASAWLPPVASRLGFAHQIWSLLMTAAVAHLWIKAAAGRDALCAARASIAAKDRDAEEAAAEGEAGARDAARDCICAPDSDPDGSQPVEESVAASAVDAAASTPPSRAEVAVIRGRDDHFEHDTLRPLYPIAV